MKLQPKAKKAVIDESRMRNPSQVLRQLVYRMFDQTRVAVDTNENMSCSRLRSWMGV